MLGFSDPPPTVASLPAPRPLAFAAFAADYSLDAIPGTTGTRRR